MSMRIAASRFSSGIVSRTAVRGPTPRDASSIVREGGGRDAAVVINARRHRRGKSSIGAPASAETTGAVGSVGTATIGKVAVVEGASSSSSSSSSSVPIGTTTMAMAFAIASVSACASFAECATSSSVPIFDPRGERYVQSTFVGRLCKMLLACDPSLVFRGRDEVVRCKAMVDEYGRAVQGHGGRVRALPERPPGGEERRRDESRALGGPGESTNLGVAFALPSPRG